MDTCHVVGTVHLYIHWRHVRSHRLSADDTRVKWTPNVCLTIKSKLVASTNIKKTSPEDTIAVIQLTACKMKNYCRLCQIHQSREWGWRTSKIQAGWFLQARFEVFMMCDNIEGMMRDIMHSVRINRRLVESRRMHGHNTIKCSRTYKTPARSRISVQSSTESTCYVTLPSSRSLSKVSFVMRGSADAGSNISVRYSDRCGVICEHAEWLILMMRPPDMAVMQPAVGYSNDKNGNTICRLASMRSRFQFTASFIPTYCTSNLYRCTVHLDIKILHSPKYARIY
jgi:hypothetical protein